MTDSEIRNKIADFPSAILREKYRSIPNLGDMTHIPEKIQNGEMEAPDLICGGTPCQAFSFAGFQNGLNDDRGNLTLKYVDIIDANDRIRMQQGKQRSVVFWEIVPPDRKRAITERWRISFRQMHLRKFIFPQLPVMVFSEELIPATVN